MNFRSQQVRHAAEVSKHHDKRAQSTIAAIIRHCVRPGVHTNHGSPGSISVPQNPTRPPTHPLKDTKPIGHRNTATYHWPLLQTGTRSQTRRIACTLFMPRRSAGGQSCNGAAGPQHCCTIRPHGASSSSIDPPKKDSVKKAELPLQWHTSTADACTHNHPWARTEPGDAVLQHATALSSQRRQLVTDVSVRHTAAPLTHPLAAAFDLHSVMAPFAFASHARPAVTRRQGTALGKAVTGRAARLRPEALAAVRTPRPPATRALRARA